MCVCVCVCVVVVVVKELPGIMAGILFIMLSFLLLLLLLNTLCYAKRKGIDVSTNLHVGFSRYMDIFRSVQSVMSDSL